MVVEDISQSLCLLLSDPLWIELAIVERPCLDGCLFSILVGHSPFQAIESVGLGCSRAIDKVGEFYEFLCSTDTELRHIIRSCTGCFVNSGFDGRLPP